MPPKQTAPHSWELLRLPPCSGQALRPLANPVAGAGPHPLRAPLPEQAARQGSERGSEHLGLQLSSAISCPCDLGQVTPGLRLTVLVSKVK